MRFKEFIIETASYPIVESMPREEILEWIKLHSKEYLKKVSENKAGLIFRGSKNGEGIGDSSKFIRKAANTTNILNLFVSNEWTDYPPRNQSYIASTSSGYADNYGKVHYVIPTDTAKLGVCISNDFWFSFKDEFLNAFDGSVKGFNYFLQDTIGLNIEQNDYAKLKEQLQSISRNDIDSRFIQSEMKRGETLYDWMKHYLNPNNHFFKHCSPSQLGSDLYDQEVWVYGKVAFLDMKTFDLQDWAKEQFK